MSDRLLSETVASIISVLISAIRSFNAESLKPHQTAARPVEDHMTQHIHPRRSVTACLKSADVTVLPREVGVRGNGIKEGFQEDKTSQARE